MGKEDHNTYFQRRWLYGINALKACQEIVFYRVSVVLRSVDGWWNFNAHTSLCEGHNPGMDKLCEDVSLKISPCSQRWNSDFKSRGGLLWHLCLLCYIFINIDIWLSRQSNFICSTWEAWEVLHGFQKWHLLVSLSWNSLWSHTDLQRRNSGMWKGKSSLLWVNKTKHHEDTQMDLPEGLPGYSVHILYKSDTELLQSKASFPQL